MKPNSLMLLTIGSLAANLVLVGVLMRPPAPETPSSSETRVGIGAEHSDSQKSREPELTRWDELPMNDLPAMVARLRSEGCPPALLRAIISERVQRIFDIRLREIRSNAEPHAYWKAGLAPSLLGNATTRASLRELWQEQTTLLKNLLGPDAESPADAASLDMQRRRYGNLSSEKIAQINLINTDYSDLSTQIRRDAAGLMLPQDREALAYLESQQREDLLGVLTPDEYQDYLLRTSPKANSLRRQLIGLQPTEQEFRTVFALHHAFDETYGNTRRRNTPEWQAERRAAQQKLVDEVKAALGPERGAEYELSRDSNYVEAVVFTESQQLPKVTALEIRDVQRAAQDQANALRTNRTLAPEERAAQLDAVLQAAETRLKAALGERAFEAYRNSDAARRWLAVTRAVTQAPTLVPETP